MNGITRNLVVILSAAFLSIATVVGMIFFEARMGQSFFGYTLFSYVPVGALGAGLIVAAGLLCCAVLLRARPAPVVVIGLVAVSAGAVFLSQSAEMLLASGGRASAANPATLPQFLASAVLHTPLEFQGTQTSDSGAASSQSTIGVARAMPQTGAESDANVESISSGVQGLAASADIGTNASAGGVQRISQIGDSIHNINSAVQNHGSQWLLMALQFAGFLAGSLGVFSLLRSRPHCEDCSVLLSAKGTQKRYFDRVEEMNGSVEDVLAKAKSRRLQLSIQAQGSKGSAQKGKLSEFASVIQVSRCSCCQSSRVDFRALRKSGANWSEMNVLAYSASTFELIEIGG